MYVLCVSLELTYIFISSNNLRFIVQMQVQM